MNTVLITGASRRLGLYLTQAFLEQGCKVIALTRKASAELDALASDKLHILLLDYNSETSLAAAIDSIRGQYDALSLVVHNASLFEKDAPHKNNLCNFYDELYRVHMRLPAYLNEALEPLLYNESIPGCIVHITDIYADNPNREFGLYCSTKAALENLTKSFAKKYAPGIRVNSIAPGPLMFLPSHKEDEKKTVLGQTLLPGESGFEPILQGIRFIVDNQFVTGSCVKIDGGRSIGKI
ncbi:SDR family NAD(P)-dependent oxidoreductase [Marinobacterium rhizophilum]|uniref:SDR family NAD(P)-dependent oxidoreductase n=1 Tax=Marinobacterium rhizophilum TaxID=420402 RepID=A0ABY5HDY6_9GAMM|nr:SDR family NAD(P)-dependent oxidoreductase [Marinobacterium rhizophilum]UTW10560.1 SDR family NAD(P)-dependent oxidoreductase [Marinobacterium rhizophilum]